MFTDEELIALLQDAIDNADAGEDEPGTLTSGDVMDLLGVSRERARKILQLMAQAGHVKPSMVIRTNDWGFSKRVCGYRVIAAKAS